MLRLIREMDEDEVSHLRSCLQQLNVGAESGQVVADQPGYHLLPYQQAAVGFALDRGGRALFCHEMGLGKTPMVRFSYVFLSNQLPN